MSSNRVFYDMNMAGSLLGDTQDTAPWTNLSSECSQQLKCHQDSNRRHSPGLTASDQIDVTSTVPWKGSHCLLCDVTWCNTVAPSHLNRAVLVPRTRCWSQVVSTCEMRFNQSTALLCACRETLGPLGAEAVYATWEKSRLSNCTWNWRMTSYGFPLQRFSLAVQPAFYRDNADRFFTRGTIHCIYIFHKLRCNCFFCFNFLLNLHAGLMIVGTFAVCTVNLENRERTFRCYIGSRDCFH
jgi:hypothetical protein